MDIVWRAHLLSIRRRLTWRREVRRFKEQKKQPGDLQLCLHSHQDAVMEKPIGGALLPRQLEGWVIQDEAHPSCHVTTLSWNTDPHCILFSCLRSLNNPDRSRAKGKSCRKRNKSSCALFTRQWEDLALTKVIPWSNKHIHKLIKPHSDKIHCNKNKPNTQTGCFNSRHPC